MTSEAKSEEAAGFRHGVPHSRHGNSHLPGPGKAEGEWASTRGADGVMKALGSAQVMLGLSLAFFGGFLFTDLSVAASTGTPWWSGLPLIVAGSLTISSENKRASKYLVKACFGVNIITCVLIGFSVLILSFDVAVTVIFALVYRYWIISFLMKIVFLMFFMAGLGISVTVLVIERKQVFPQDKPEIAMESVEVSGSPSHMLNPSHPAE